MTALSITPEFISRYAPRYEITELEERLLSKDAKKARKKERLKYKSLLRFAEWKAIAVLPMLSGYSDKETQNDIEYLTFLALEEDTPDRWRIPILSIIDGVGKPFASAILSAVYPDHFALMDARAVGVLFDAGLLDTKNTARVPYEDYLGVVKMLASEAGVSFHEVYRALYAYAELGEISDDTAAKQSSSSGASTTASQSSAQKTTTAKSEGQKPASQSTSNAKSSGTSASTSSTAKKSTAGKAAPKKTAAKKTTVKKSTAKKTTAKKSTGKKSKKK